MKIKILEDVEIDACQFSKQRVLKVTFKKNVTLEVHFVSQFEDKKYIGFKMDDLFESESTFVLESKVFTIIEGELP